MFHSKNFLLYIALLAIAFSIIPAITLAHTPNILTGGYWGQASINPQSPAGLVSCTAPLIIDASGVPTRNDNTACRSLCDLIHTFFHVLMFGMSLTLYIAAPLLFAWGGVLILISAGNSGKISEARKILTGTVIGVLIILSAFLIVKTFILALDLGSSIPGFGSAFSCIPR